MRIVPSNEQHLGAALQTVPSNEQHLGAALQIVPFDIACLICEEMIYPDVLSLGRTCQYWQQIVNNDQLWKYLLRSNFIPSINYDKEKARLKRELTPKQMYILMQYHYSRSYQYILAIHVDLCDIPALEILMVPDTHLNIIEEHVASTNNFYVFSWLVQTKRSKERFLRYYIRHDRTRMAQYFLLKCDNVDVGEIFAYKMSATMLTILLPYAPKFLLKGLLLSRPFSPVNSSIQRELSRRPS